MPHTAIVIPCIRWIDPDILKWVPKDVMVYVVDDTGEEIGVSVPNKPNIRVLTYKDQDKYFKSDYHRETFMSRKSAGCRNFGILQAWKDGAEIIINLDDDVNMPQFWVEKYQSILTEEQDFNILYTDTKWLNTIDSNRWFARGFPYQDRGDYVHQKLDHRDRLQSKVHMGVWSNVLDLNGIDKIPFPSKVGDPTIPTSTGFGSDLWYAYNRYIPLCAMNVGAVRDSVFALLQLPMGHAFDAHYRIQRIEDIWGGYIYQKLVASGVTFGMPEGFHLKVGNRDFEIWGENYANLLAKDFEHAIDGSAPAAFGETIPERYNKLGWELNRYANGVLHWNEKSCPEYFRHFVLKLANTMVVWSEAFS